MGHCEEECEGGEENVRDRDRERERQRMREIWRSGTVIERLFILW